MLKNPIQKKLFFALLCLPFSVWAFDNSPTLYMMKTVPQTHFLNPSFMPEQQWYTSFLGVAPSNVRLNAGTNDLALSEVATLDGKILTIDAKKILNGLRTNNAVGGSAAIHIVDFGFRVARRNYLSLFLRTRLVADVDFTKDLASLLLEGAKDETTNVRIGSRGTMYHEMGFSFARQHNKRLTWGVRPKLLLGVATARFTQEATLTGDGSKRTLKISGNGYRSIPSPKTENPKNFRDLFERSKNTFSVEDYISFSSPGVAVDLGATYQLMESLKVSVSLVDWGMIFWKGNVLQGRDTTVDWGGVELKKGKRLADLFANKTDNLLPTFQSLFNINDSNIIRSKEGENSFTQRLKPKIYMGAEYEFFPWLTAGGLLYLAFPYYGGVQTSFTLSANLKTIKPKILAFSTSFTVAAGSLANMGLGLSLTPGPFQFYFTFDYLWPYIPEMNHVGTTVGINMLFGKKKRSQGPSFMNTGKEARLPVVSPRPSQEINEEELEKEAEKAHDEAKEIIKEKREKKDAE